MNPFKWLIDRLRFRTIGVVTIEVDYMKVLFCLQMTQSGRRRYRYGWRYKIRREKRNKLLTHSQDGVEIVRWLNGDDFPRTMRKTPTLQEILVKLVDKEMGVKP